MKKMNLQFVVGALATLAMFTAWAFGIDIKNDGGMIAIGLMGTLGVLDTATLLEVQRVQKTPLSFWLENGFKRQINFTDEYIAFDRVNEDYRRMAPFVAPNVKGKVLAREGSDMVAFKPAYVKPKHIIDINDPIVRQPGEALGGDMTPQQRRDAIIAALLERHKNMHATTREILAARAIIDGKVDIEGENYPKVTVDFRRDSSLTITLTGAAKWDTTTATPLLDIGNARKTSNGLCGAVIRDIIFGAEAWALFSDFADVKELLSEQSRGSESNFTKVVDGFDDQVEFLGEIKGVQGAGLLRLWMYSGKYRDENNVLTDILHTKEVVGVDWATLSGHRCFGAIRDGRAGFRALDMFPKIWEEEDPWAEYLMTQSAPLMVPGTPNASFKIRVA